MNATPPESRASLSVERERVRAASRAALFGEDPEPVKIGRFLVVERIGAGGMGVVYVAYDPKLRREIAIKLLHRDRARRGHRRLLREAQAMGRVSHPNVVSVYETGQHEGAVFIAMELVRGKTLDAWLQAPGRSAAEIIEAFVSAGEGLAAAHQVGLVHRDFKPQNVLVGDDGRVRVLDFGLARASETVVAHTVSEARGAVEGEALEALTRTGSILGTPAYMSPEQYEGSAADARSDQFSFAVALYEALYGRRPFEGKTFEQLAASVTAGEVALPPRQPGVSGQARRGVLRALRREPSERWPDMPSLLDQIQPRKTRGWIAVGVLGAAALGGVASTFVADEPCVVPDTSELWSDERQATLASAFEVLDPGQGIAGWNDVEPRLTDYVERWSSARDSACEATDPLAPSGRACVLAARAELETLLGLFSEGDPSVLATAGAALFRLPDPALCNGDSPLGGALPPSPRIAERVSAIRRTIGRGWAFHTAGNPAKATEAATSALDDARQIGFRPAEAEALHLLFRAQHLAGEPPRQQLETLLDLSLVAEATGQTELVALAAAWTLEYTYDPARFREWEARAEAALERIGDRPSIRGVLEFSRGYEAARSGDFEDAAAHFRRSADLHREGEALRGRGLFQTGRALARGGDPDAGLPLMQQGLDYYAETLAPNHPRVGWALRELANHQAQAGRLGDAERSAEQAIALFTDRDRPLDHDAAQVFINLFALHWNNGHLDEAMATLDRLEAVVDEKPDDLEQKIVARAARLSTDAAFGRSPPLEALKSLAAALVRCGTPQCQGWQANAQRFTAAALAREGRAEDALALVPEPGSKLVDDSWATGAAEVHLFLGRPARALSLLRQDSPEHDLLRGLALADLGRAAEAIPLLERSIVEEKKSWVCADAELALARLLAEDEPPRARALTEQALSNAIHPTQRAKAEALLGELTTAE